MQFLGTLVALFGIGCLLLGHLGFLVAAFRKSLLWGLAVLFLPVVPLVFLIIEWERAKRPFFLELWGLAFLLAGVIALDWRP